MARILTRMLHKTNEKYPDRIAFKFGKESLTYKDFLLQSNQLANVLIEWGVRPGDRVGIYLDRCMETALAIYGTMLAGAVYVPLDPSAPAIRTHLLLKDCSIKHLVSRQSLAPNLGKVIVPYSNIRLIVGLDSTDSPRHLSWDQLKQAPNTNPGVSVKETDLAYIMYTSGSTGVPKGIMHTHYSGYSYAKLSAELYKLGADDVVASHAPLHFDISTMAYLTVPLVGASSVIISDAHTKLPVSLSQLVEDDKLTVWYSVPLALIQMLNYGLLEERNITDLRLVLYGGEPFPPKYLRELMLRWPQAQFCNVYGPAEVNQCTYHFIPDVPVDDQPVPIGKVWAETKIQIVDRHGNEVIPGKKGELVIKSSTMMKGYWNNPELTERSLLNSGNGTDNGLFYKTGDLVKQDHEGDLHFLGRKDRQVKTRGYRVELEMVEAALNDLDEVQEAAVFVTVKEQQGNMIEAAIIPGKFSADLEKTIKTKLAETLPKYAIPTKIYQLSNLPRTTTGKIDYQRFRETIEENNHI